MVYYFFDTAISETITLFSVYLIPTKNTRSLIRPVY